MTLQMDYRVKQADGHDSETGGVVPIIQITNNNRGLETKKNDLPHTEYIDLLFCFFLRKKTRTYTPRALQ